MIHYLTIGYIDKKAVQNREILGVKPLSNEIMVFLKKFTDNDPIDGYAFEGEDLEVTKFFIKCPWYSPRRNKTTEKFAISVKRMFCCVVADIEHGRLIDECELDFR